MRKETITVEKRKPGSSGLKILVISLGTWVLADSTFGYPEDLEQAKNQSLEYFQTDHIDLSCIYYPREEVINSEVMEGLNRLGKSGESVSSSLDYNANMWGYEYAR